MMCSWFRKIVQLKWLLVALGIGVFLIISWISVMEWVSQTLKSREADIEVFLKERLGSPIQFSSIQTGWSGLSVSITLNDIVILDKQKKIPLLSARQLKIGSTVPRFLFKKDRGFNQITIDGLKARIKWTEKNDFSLLGLGGETLSSKADDQALMQGLATQESIVFTQAELYWAGSEMTLLQKVDGKLFWEDVESLSWRFIGQQQVKINEGNFLPVTTLDLKMEPAIHQLKMLFDMAGIHVDSTLTLLDQSPLLTAEISVRNTRLELFHQDLVLKAQDSKWVRWLVQALEKGVITEGLVKIKGPIHQLDWQGDLAYKQLEVRYSEAWPSLQGVKGEISFSKDKVEINIARGSILGASLKPSQVIIAPLMKTESPVVMVEGSVEGSLEQGLKFLQSSPLETAARKMALLNPEGPMDLQLSLKIPLDQRPNQVQGKVKVNNADIKLEQIHSSVTDLSGIFDFTEDGITGQDVKGKWLGQWLQFEVMPSYIKTKLLVDSHFLKSQFKTDYLKYLKGQSEVTIGYWMDKDEWTVESNLKGMEIDLPFPFAKSKDSEHPIVFTVQTPLKKQEQKYSLSLKDALDAKWIVGVSSGQENFKRGHLVLGAGKADWRSTNNFLIEGDISTLDIDIWKAFLGTLKGGSQPFSVNLHLLAKEVKGFGINFKDTWINFNYSKNKSEWLLDGPAIKGSLVFPSKDQKTMLLSFDHLKLVGREVKHQKDNEFFKEGERFPIEFFSKHIELDGTVYGEVGFYLEPTSYGYQIKNLSIRTADSRLEGNGLWRLVTPEKEELTFLQGDLFTDNISNTFTQWGFSVSMREGKGRISFNLNWPGSPFQLSLKSAQGGARLKIRNGRILGVDPGLGKILGLLSFESLTRRLQLDFRDVLQKGFAFDTLGASVLFQEGHAITDNLNLDGPAADIHLSGNTDLETKQLDFQMVVIPKMGNTLPLAAGLATGNPAIGLGVWVIDKLTGSRISQASKRYYHVTGTWDAPSMRETGGSNRRNATRR